MIVLTAPDAVLPPKPYVFLAGGITDCPDWQATAIRHLAHRDFRGTVFNPRRASFDPKQIDAVEQIKWEFQRLQEADAIIFWFAKSPSPQPISLYELGRWATQAQHTNHRSRLFVGADPEYSRRLDVVTQMGLLLPWLFVHNSLSDVVDAFFEDFRR